jgi:hypothetical protein
MSLYKWSQTPAADATADASINWQEGQAPSSVNDSARAMMAATAKYRDDNSGSLTTGGTSTAYTLMTNQIFDTLAHMSGHSLTFAMSATSGAAPTLNVDGLGAKVIRNATGVALPTGALLSGSVYSATYNNSSGEWLLHNQPAVFQNLSISGTLTATGAATLSSTLAVTGDFAVNANKFTVAASSGNALVAGSFTSTGAGTFSSTLSAVGNFAVNTNKFNVVAASGNTAIAGTLAVTGASTLTGAVSASSSVLSSSASAGIGYATGAGSTVTQATSKSTAVTLNAICGQITTNNAFLAQNAVISFTLNNSSIAATDVVVVSKTSGGSSGASYQVWSSNIVAGSCSIGIINYTGSGSSDTLVLQFAVIKSVAS